MAFNGFGNSTGNPASTPSLFGQQAQKDTNAPSLFGAPAKDATATPSLFGQPAKEANTSTSLFGQPAPNSAPAGLFGTSQQKPSLFGSKDNSSSNATASNPFSSATSTASPFSFAKPDAKPASTFNLFSTPNKSDADTAKPPTSTPAPTFSLTSSTTPAGPPPQNNPFGGFSTKPLFPSAPIEQKLGPSQNLFGAKADNPADGPKLAEPTATTQDKPVTNLFGNPAEKPNLFASKPAEPTGGLFGKAGPAGESAAPVEKPLFTLGAKNGLDAAKPTTDTTSTETAKAPEVAKPLFGAETTKPASDTAKNPFSKPAETSALGASTAGPAPAAQSKLKNKSMDEIITKWATDLSKYQKEFQAQAEKVAAWDRTLLENGNDISKLYSKTYQAERDTAEVQKQLTAVESQQEEISQMLDRYEREVEDMTNRQIGEPLQGPDQERERTYKVAERVSLRLDEMGKDLTSMIDEINDVTATISKTSKPDDPVSVQQANKLSQIVRILNSHLSQLQIIDQGTAELQAKVTSAQQESRQVQNSAVDHFYRSYRN